jgi:hypothetical protein
MTTIHTFLVVAPVREWSISQLDVRISFLMVSYVRRFTCMHRLVILFLRVFYAFVFTTASFSASAHDLSLFIHVSTRSRTLLLYVDDMILTGDDPQYIMFVRPHLSDLFLMFGLSVLRYFLGIEFSSTTK